MIKFIVLIVVLLVTFGLMIFSIILLLGPMITWFQKAPFVPSFDYHLRLMKQHLKLRKGARLVDLGCGDGKALRFFSKEFGLLGEGYEINPFVSRYAKLLNRLRWTGDISIIRSNFQKAQLDKYDYIYVYLFPKQLIMIEDRIFDHMGKDTIIISNSFKFVQHTPYQTICDKKGREVIRLYRK